MRYNKTTKYLEHRVNKGPGKRVWRDWWLIKGGPTSGNTITMQELSIDNEFAGKRFKLKLELIDDLPNPENL